MDEALEEVGVDPYHTPVDRLPEQGAWALVSYFAEQNGDVYE
jgi:hypothetical protein